MESKWVKVLDNGHRTVVDLKRKQAAQYAANVSEVRHKAVLLRSKHSSLLSKLGKRKRFDECKSKCGVLLGKSVPKNYSNFMKSGLPQRVLYYQKGEWSDFPQDIVESVREEFKLKKAAIEVRSNGCHSMLDILYMIQVDLKTGSQKPIAWIDEAGRCFFPQLDSAEDVMHEKYKPVLEEKELLPTEPNGTREINVHLQIELTGANSYGVEECIEESNTCAKRIKMKQNSCTNDLVHCANDDDDNNEKYEPKIEEANRAPKNGENLSFKLERGFQTVDIDYVREMFFMGMKSSLGVNLLDINKCSSKMMQTRWEMFQKQVEVTHKYRGDPNVHYAWLAASKDVLSSASGYGLAHCGSQMFATYGLGVHLTPVKCAAISANYCDVDENGLRHMLFCRVILGKMELLHRGSKQFHPSSENFDNGVDDMQNPSHYIVWNMNMSTHIYPEYVVSFKMLDKNEDAPFNGKAYDGGVEGIHCMGQPDQAQIGSSEVESGKAPSSGSSAAKTPKSPWMPFSMLFDAISLKVSQDEMNRLYSHYDELKGKKISRDAFIKKLRLIAGDQLLKTTIYSLQNKLPSFAKPVLAVPEEQKC